MNDFHTIYYNTVGIAFQLKRAVDADFSKIMMVYKDKFLALSKSEVVNLINIVNQMHINNPSKNEVHNPLYLLKYHPDFSLLLNHNSNCDMNALLEFLKGTLKQVEHLNSCEISQKLYNQ